MKKYLFGFAIAIFIGLALAQGANAGNNFPRVVDGINEINASIENINKIIKAVNEGEEYLKNNYPGATKDVAAMINEMGKTLVALSSASSIITNFSFIMDEEQFSHDLKKFNEHLLERKTLSSQLSAQLERMRGHCSKIKEHAQKIQAETKVPRLFQIIGVKSKQGNDELSKSLGQIYDEEIQHYLAVNRMSSIIELALNDIQETLGGPGMMAPNKVPEAAELLRKYSREFLRIEAKSNYMVLKIKKLVIELD